MATSALLTISRMESPKQVVDALVENAITYFPRSSPDSPETMLEVHGVRFYGSDQILQHMDEIRSIVAD